MIDYILFFLNYIQTLIDNNYFSALIIYFSFCLFFFFLSLPGGLIVTLSSGFFFGFYIGFLINIISIVFGSFVFTIISKYFLHNFFNIYLLKYIDKLNNLIKESSYEYLILIRIIFGVPLIIQNLFISTLEISKFKIILSSFIGFTPYALIFSFAGDKISSLIDLKNFTLNKIFSIELLIIILIFIGLIFIRIYLNKKNNLIK